MPPPEVFKMLGERYSANAITAHFDVGDITAYHSLGGDYASIDADGYLVPSSLARGGELIRETACVPDTQDPPRWHCQFPDYPGTVGWMAGFQHYRDQPVKARRHRIHHRRNPGLSRGWKLPAHTIRSASLRFLPLPVVRARARHAEVASVSGFDRGIRRTWDTSKPRSAKSAIAPGPSLKHRTSTSTPITSMCRRARQASRTCRAAAS